jgi:hypothetical protein
MEERKFRLFYHQYTSKVFIFNFKRVTMYGKNAVFFPISHWKQQTSQTTDLPIARALYHLKEEAFLFFTGHSFT